jgi:L-seryl-tRNA(Ser) seleniumtransferase
MDPNQKVKQDARRSLPAVDRLVRALAQQRPDLAGWALPEAVRRVLEAERQRLAGEPEGAAAGERELARRAAAAAAALTRVHPARVVNATGVVLHTNLGRAPLAAGAAAAVAEAAAHYSDLEFDLASGRRGDRGEAVAAKLALLSGAESALAVNNNAAALFLALGTLARGRQVIVSRGELVEIGGSFRVPEILERAGVELVEVGTTNRTHLADYERALGPRSALLLKVHRSNFELRGFTAEAALPELAQLGRAHGVPVVEDLGSGTLVDLTAHGLPAESFAPARLRLGADLVCFSGDKLLGGPQAGILLGRARHVDALRRDPVARALRLDKLSLAALDWTLECMLAGRAEREITVLHQLLEPVARLELRARRLAERLGKAAGGAVEISLLEERTLVGGGSLPGFELGSWAVALRGPAPAEELAARLRAAEVPVVARVRDALVLIDVRTLLDDDEALVESALAAACAALPR